MNKKTGGASTAVAPKKNTVISTNPSLMQDKSATNNDFFAQGVKAFEKFRGETGARQ